MQGVLSGPSVAQVAYFNSLKIDAPDATTLFDLLDYDQSGEIDLEDSSGVQDAVGTVDFCRYMYVL